MLPNYMKELAEDGYTLSSGAVLPFATRLTHPTHGTEMAVDGTTPLIFDLPAHTKDRVIKSVMLVLVDKRVRSHKFGDLDALNSGISVSYVYDGTHTGFLITDAKTIGDLHIQTAGNGSTVEQLKDSKTEAYIVQLNPMEIPLYVRANSTDTIRLYLEDNLLDLDQMYVEVSGYMGSA